MPHPYSLALTTFLAFQRSEANPHFFPSASKEEAEWGWAVAFFVATNVEWRADSLLSFRKRGNSNSFLQL